MPLSGKLRSMAAYSLSRMNIRLVAFLTLCSAAMAADATAPKAAPASSKSPAPIPADTEWHDVTQWGVEGRGWINEKRKSWFDRLPAKAEGKVTTTVWERSLDSAGMMVRFKTNATSIFAKYSLTKASLASPAMPATGVSGLDLYARDDQGHWRWVMVTKPDKQNMEVLIQAGLTPGLREYCAYLPLYNGVVSLSIGVPKGSVFEGLAPRAEKPIIFYGTSITHGADASRPGMECMTARNVWFGTQGADIPLPCCSPVRMPRRPP